MNLGQLAMVLRAKYLIDIQSHTQVRGLPFRAAELAAVVQDVIDGTTGTLPTDDTSSDHPADPTTQHTVQHTVAGAAQMGAAL